MAGPRCGREWRQLNNASSRKSAALRTWRNRSLMPQEVVYPLLPAPPALFEPKIKSDFACVATAEDPTGLKIMMISDC